MMRIRLDNCKPSFKDFSLRNYFSDKTEKQNNFVFTGSGKAALSVVLQFLKEKEILENKMSSILVPKWIGIAVYQTLLTQCFTTTRFTEDVKAIIAYHQYGFPQNMDKLIDFCQEKKVTLIEDCAHTIDSRYKGIPLGSFGDFSIYSFSKFCFCFALGGISFKNPEFENFFKKKKESSPCLLKNLINTFKLLDESSLNRGVNFENTRGMIYSLYPKSLKSGIFSQNLFESKMEHEISIRKRNYNYLKDQLCNYEFTSFLDADVVPYAVPLLITKNRDRIISKLREMDIECGEYWFDVNRFVIEPKFERCILIPIHSNVTLEHMNFITSTITECL